MTPVETAATPVGTSGPLLEIRDLGFTYNRGRGPAVSEVNLTVAPGEFLLLAGGSGSGKTTLLRAACGLVPHFFGGALSGRVTVAGRDTAAAGPGELASAAGYVAQDPETQIVSTTVAAELDLPLEFRGVDPSIRARAVEEVALALNIGHLLDRPAGGLSGGETQRVALAAALVTRPPLILLDEPTSQLDPVAGDELIWLLRRLNQEWGVAVVLAEHRLERCLPVSDRVLAMEGGRIEFDGSPGRFLEFAGEARPALATPLARLFSEAGLTPLPVGVRDARLTLRDRGVPTGNGGGTLTTDEPRLPPGSGRRRRSGSGRKADGSGLAARSLWVELDSGEGPVGVLRGIDLEIRAGERVALMGRNGAGKSTLLRTAAGLVSPVRGRIEAPGGVALLTQNPGDFLVRDRIGDELPGTDGEAALRAVALDVDPGTDPRDLSGGERQRLALAIALAGRIAGDVPPGVVALDEPTRGMDRALKRNLIGLCGELAERGSAVLVATHDVEFAAGFAERVILLGDGVVIADASSRLVLSGGWYFATEVSRVLDVPGVITVEQGLRHIREHTG